MRRSLSKQPDWSLRMPRLARFLSILSCAAVLALGANPARTQQALPLEVQIDLALIELERAVGSGDHAAVLDLIDQLRTLSPASGAGELLFFEAEAALALGDHDRAEAALTQFVSTVGRGSELYTPALQMLLDVPKLREQAQAEKLAEERAELERAREQERQEIREAQAERARQAAAREAAARAEERQVLNSLALVRDVRFRLNALYGDRYGLPVPTTLDDPLTDAERGWMQRLQIAGRFVDSDALRQIRSLAFEPWPSGPFTEGVQSFSDWYTFVAQNGVCAARTRADEFPDGTVYYKPELGVSYDPDWDRRWLGLRLVSPNPFRTDRPITLRAAETEHRLVLHENGTSIVPEGSWADLTRALQAGRRIEVTGTDIYTNESLTIGFSAIGFTSALRQIAEQCDRTPELGLWLRQ